MKKTASGWLVINSQILFKVKGISSTIAASSLTTSSIITSLDTANYSLTIGGQTITLPSSFTAYWYYDDTQLPGFTVNSSNISTLQTYFNEAAALGLTVEVYYTPITMKKTASGWTSTNSYIYFKVKGITSSISTSSILNSVDTANNTITIGDKTITLPSSLNIYWYYDGSSNVSISNLTDLQSRFNEAQALGLTAEIAFSNLPIKKTATGWTCASSSTIYFNVSGIISNIGAGSPISAVNDNSVTIGGQNIILPPTGTTLYWYDGYNNVAISLAALKVKFDEAEAAGLTVETRYALNIKKTIAGSQFMGTQIYFYTNNTSTINSASLVTDLDTANNSITIGTQTVTLPQDFSISWYYDDAYITGIYTLSDLQAKFDEAKNMGLDVELKSNIAVSKTASGWAFTSPFLTLSVKGIISSIGTGSSVTAASVSGIAIGGQLITLPSTTVIYWRDGASSVMISLADLQAKISEAASAGLTVKAYSGQNIKKGSSGWEYMDSAVNFYMDSGISYISTNSTVTDINKSNNSITIGGQAIMLPSSFSINWYHGGKFISYVTTLDDLESKINEAHESGATVEMYNSISITKTSGNWKFASTGISFNVTGDSSYIATDSAITNVDTSNNTITIGNIDIKLPSSTIIYWYDGSSATQITLTDLYNKYADAESAGAMLKTYSNQTIKNTSSGWQYAGAYAYFSSNIVADSGFSMPSGLKVGDIDDTNKTITIGGQVISMPASAVPIQWYDGISYVTVSLAELHNKLTEAENAGYAVETYGGYVNQTAEGLQFANSSIRFYVNKGTFYINSGSALSDVDSDNATITIGDLAAAISSYTKVYWYDGVLSTQISLAELKNKLTAAQAAGLIVQTYSAGNPYLKKTPDGWLCTSSSIYFRVGTDAAARVTASGNGVVSQNDLDVANKTITVNGITMATPDNGLITFNGSIVYGATTEAMLNNLASLISNNAAVGNLTVVSPGSGTSLTYMASRGWKIETTSSGYSPSLSFTTRASGEFLAYYVTSNVASSSVDITNKT
ncbi:MAG: hypothetical protein WC980_10825, partial [Candidatus Brocadiia bacterium]